MTALQLRKQTLLLESDLNRLTLEAHCAHLRKAGTWAGGAREMRRHVAPWALVMAPLVGLTLALGLRRPTSGGSFLARALGIAPSLIHLWRTWAAPANDSK